MGSNWRIGGLAAALVLLAAPLAAQGRGQGPGMPGMRGGGPGAMERNPAALVLDHRAELDLTDEQVSRLEVIRERVAGENGPRWEQLREAFGDVAPQELSVEERQALRDRMRELRPLRQEIRATNRAAGQEIHEILTVEQSTALRTIMHADRRSGMRPMHRGGPGAHRGPGPQGGPGPHGPMPGGGGA